MFRLKTQPSEILSRLSALTRGFGCWRRDAAPTSGVDTPPAPLRIELSGDPPAMQWLLQRVKAQWEHLGACEPYWSVLTHDQFKLDRLDEAHLRDFYHTGLKPVRQLERLLDTFEIVLPDKTALDFGCGVGRVSLHLLERGYRTTGIDISPGNLAIAEQRCREYGSRFQPRRLSDPDDIDRLEPVSLMLSVLTLQHNPPPIQRQLLAKLLARLKPGGVAFFQLPTHRPGYRFEVARFIAEPDPAVMDMHCLPMSAVLETLREQGLSVLDVQRDNWAGADFHSHKFLAIKCAR